MSKIEKLRGRLASIHQDREEFERQKKALEDQMRQGRKNMDKIQKGLKNNVILNDPQILESAMDMSNSPKRLSRRDMKSFVAAGAAASMNNVLLNEMSGGLLQVQIIIPSGPRISDWCFTGPLDSAPPIVKTRAMYENVRLLGRGAFGEVNLVKNIEDNKLFAIKTIFCSKDRDLDPVLREIRFLRACRHPCIIDVHDSFITTNPRVVHIVMHYCESGSLASVISSAKKTKTFIAEAQILKWVVQLTLALHFLHERNVLHRDLKPMNVMLTEGGDLVKLADFGLAMNLEDSDEQANNDEAGTPYYTAPEMIQRENYSYPADCWSFGIIIYQLMALERPFEGNSTAELVRAILTLEPAALPPHYSEELKNICKSLLEKNQNQRLTMRTLLCDPLVFPKVANFPQVYRPKNLEERIRRSHLRLLEQQIEMVQRARRASTLAHQSSTRSKSELSLSSGNMTPQAITSTVLPVTVEEAILEKDEPVHPIREIDLELQGMVITGTHLHNSEAHVSEAERAFVRVNSLTGEEVHHHATDAQHNAGHARHPVASITPKRAASGHPGEGEDAGVADILLLSEELVKQRESQAAMEKSPKGGRVGSEIARAIHHDHVIETMLASPSAAAPAVSES